jgi:GntR family transcriptional regulator, transcriptional repressor for pyruvate dehydrogenase complex
VDDELIRLCGLATRVACQRMTPHYLRALCDSVEQACCLSAGFAWDRKAMAHAEIVNVLADSAADPILVLLVRNVPGHLYDLMVTAGPTADGIVASSRRRLLALIRAQDADGAGREMEQHVEGLSRIAERRCVARSRSSGQGRDRLASRTVHRRPQFQFDRTVGGDFALDTGA